MKQQTLTGLEKYGKTTRRARFLADMERIIPWPELTAAVLTVYPKISESGGRPPIALERMLRIYLLQLWFNLSDPAVEEALYDSVAMQRHGDARIHAQQFDEAAVIRQEAQRFRPLAGRRRRHPGKVRIIRNTHG